MLIQIICSQRHLKVLAEGIMVRWFLHKLKNIHIDLIDLMWNRKNWLKTNERKEEEEEKWYRNAGHG